MKLTKYPFTVRFENGREYYPYAYNARDAAWLAETQEAQRVLTGLVPDIVLVQRADEPDKRNRYNLIERLLRHWLGAS